MRLFSASALALTLALSLGACGDDGDDDSSRKVNLDTTPSASPGDEPSKETSSVKEAEGDKPVDGQVQRGLNPAKSGEEKAVAEAWFAFWAEITRSYTTVEIDRDRLAELATGEAFSNPVAYVDQMKSAKTHNEGGSIAGITDINMDGDSAEVSSCIRSSLIEVNKKGVPVETLTPFITSKETLKKEGPAWRVVEHAVEPSGACKFR